MVGHNHIFPSLPSTPPGAHITVAQHHFRWFQTVTIKRKPLSRTVVNLHTSLRSTTTDNHNGRSYLMSTATEVRQQQAMTPQYQPLATKANLFRYQHNRV